MTQVALDWLDWLAAKRYKYFAYDHSLHWLQINELEMQLRLANSAIGEDTMPIVDEIVHICMLFELLNCNINIFEHLKGQSMMPGIGFIFHKHSCLARIIL